MGLCKAFVLPFKVNLDNSPNYYRMLRPLVLLLVVWSQVEAVPQWGRWRPWDNSGPSVEAPQPSDQGLKLMVEIKPVPRPPRLPMPPTHTVEPPVQPPTNILPRSMPLSDEAYEKEPDSEDSRMVKAKKPFAPKGQYEYTFGLGKSGQ